MPLSECHDISGDMRRYKAIYNWAYIAADRHEFCSKFPVKFFYGSTRHVYDIFGEIVTDYYDIVRVSLTFVRVLRHPYEIPSILFEITTCLYEFISVLHDQFRVCTI